MFLERLGLAVAAEIRAVVVFVQAGFASNTFLEYMGLRGSRMIWVDGAASSPENALIDEVARYIEKATDGAEWREWLERFAVRYPEGWVLVSNADHAPGFAQALLDTTLQGVRVALSFHALPSSLTLPNSSLVLHEDDLALTFDEAMWELENILPQPATHFELSPPVSDEGLLDSSLFNLADFHLERETVRAWWCEHKGALNPFLQEAQRKLGLFSAWEPGPVGPQPLDPMLANQSTAVWLERLIQHRCLREAFEVAIFHVPERALELLEGAAHLYHQEFPR